MFTNEERGVDMTDEERARLEAYAELMIKVGHEKRQLRLLAWIAGGAGLGLGVLLGRWTQRDRRS